MRVAFSTFCGQKESCCFKYCNIHTQKLHIISFIFSFFLFWLKIATTQILILSVQERERLYKPTVYRTGFWTTYLYFHVGNSFEDKDFHIAKRRPKDGVSFGMIPNTTINKLLDRQNRSMRAEGALTLTQELEAR